jgi:phospholipase D1/2
VAVVIEDPPVRQAHMNGQSVPLSLLNTCLTRKWNVAPFAASLRRRLCREHLGLLHPDEPNHITANSHPLPAGNEYDWDSKEDLMVADPLSPQFAQLLNATAQKNTEIFRNVFHSVPDDTSMLLIWAY